MSAEEFRAGTGVDLADLGRSSRLSALLTALGVLLAGGAVYTFAISRGAPKEQVAQFEKSVALKVDTAVKTIPSGPPGPPGPGVDAGQWTQLQVKLDSLPDRLAERAQVDPAQWKQLQAKIDNLPERLAERAQPDPERIAAAVAARWAKRDTPDVLSPEELKRLGDSAERLERTLNALAEKMGERLSPAAREMSEAQVLLKQIRDLLGKHR